MWRIPFAHHPPYSAGPRHHNTPEMAQLIPMFQRSGVKVMFTGHEHNFQHSRGDGIDYFVTGAAGRFRAAVPDGTDEAHTVSWSADCHFLLAAIDGNRMIVRAIGETPGQDIPRRDPAGAPVSSPMEIRLGSR